MNAGTVSIRLLQGVPADLRELQRVVEGAPGYYERTAGVPAGPAEAQSIYSALPEGKDYSDLFVFGIDKDGAMAGCAVLLRGYPVPTTVMLGLLLVAEAHQRQGIGTRALRLLERFARDWGTCARMRIGVVQSNGQVMPFWLRQGFEPTGERRAWRQGSVASEVLLLEKPLPLSATNT